MSSTSRSPDGKQPDKPDKPDEPEKKTGSPGRYSLADDGDDVPSTRIDSTTRMPAVRVDSARRPSLEAPPEPGSRPKAEPNAPPSSRAGGAARPPPPPPPPSSKDPLSQRRPPIALPSRPQPPSHGTQRAMPAPLAKGAAPAKTPPPGSALPAIPKPSKLPNEKPSSEKPPKSKPSSEKPPKSGRSRAAEIAKAKDKEKGTGNAKPEDPKLEDPKPEDAKADDAPLTEKGSLLPADLLKSDLPRSEPLELDQPDTLREGSVAPPSLHPASSRPPRPPSILPPRRVSSLRPPPPPKAASLPPPPPSPNLLEGFDEGSIAFAFDALVSEGPAGEAGKHDFDLAPVRELFSELAANHMRHVRDFMIDVKWGEVTRDWIHICLPPVRTLRRAAERLELAELVVALEKVGSELDTANAAGGQMLDAGEKQRLLEAYNELVTILPQAFALDRDKTQREAVIVQALLLQVPDVRKVTIDKLHAAGLTALTVLFEANADDISHVAGIPHTLAARIVERVQAYRAELKTASPQDARAAEREKLATLNATLKGHHDAYEKAASGWGPEAKAQKRDHFLAREETWLAISVLLARFGEVDRLQGIEKIPFAARIAQLTDYLEEAREKYRADVG